VNEESANTRCVPLWIEQPVLPLSTAIPSVERTPPTPTAATDNRPALLGDEVSAVANELPVNAKDRPQRGIHLSLRIIRSLQRANRQRNERLKRGNIRLTRQPQRPRHTVVDWRCQTRGVRSVASRPKLSDPARGRRGLQPGRAGRVRCHEGLPGVGRRGTRCCI
jgi:hypothetical protein